MWHKYKLMVEGSAVVLTISIPHQSYISFTDWAHNNAHSVTFETKNAHYVPIL